MVTYEDGASEKLDVGFFGRNMNDITLSKSSKGGKITKVKNVGTTEIEIQYS